MPFWSRLFGSKPDDPAPPKGEEYQDFRITATPARQGGQYRVGVRIEMEVGGALRRHDLIRADTMASADEAAAMSLAKARQLAVGWVQPTAHANVGLPPSNLHPFQQTLQHRLHRRPQPYRKERDRFGRHDAHLGYRRPPPHQRPG